MASNLTTQMAMASNPRLNLLETALNRIEAGPNAAGAVNYYVREVAAWGIGKDIKRAAATMVKGRAQELGLVWAGAETLYQAGEMPAQATGDIIPPTRCQRCNRKTGVSPSGNPYTLCYPHYRESLRDMEFEAAMENEPFYDEV